MTQRMKNLDDKGWHNIQTITWSPDGYATEELTERESQVMYGIVEGRSNQQIADIIGISEKTVRTHLHNAYGKLGVGSRSEAMAFLQRKGLVPVIAEPTTSQDALLLAQRYISIAQQLVREGK